jgi:hypothetical protein
MMPTPRTVMGWTTYGKYHIACEKRPILSERR